MRRSARLLGVALAAAFVACALIWYAALHEDQRGKLEVVFLPGGSTFVRAPSGRTMLIDGGADDSILRQLGSVTPFYERSIDVIVATALTPAKVGGLASVIPRYDSSVIVRSAARSSAPEVAAFTGAVSDAQRKGTHLAILQRGQVLDLGDGAYLEVFFPDRDASQMPPSEACLMFKLVFGETSFFFACGSPAIETYLAALDGARLKSDVLLGSGSEPELFLGFVSPQFAVMPCGASTTPSSFSKLEIQVMTTCAGVSAWISDGTRVYKN